MLNGSIRSNPQPRFRRRSARRPPLDKKKSPARAPQRQRSVASPAGVIQWYHYALHSTLLYSTPFVLLEGVHREFPSHRGTSHRKYAQNLPKAALLRALRGPHFPKEPEVLSTPSEFFGALRAQHITPHPLASGGRARRTFQFSDLVGVVFFALNQAARTWTIHFIVIYTNKYITKYRRRNSSRRGGRRSRGAPRGGRPPPTARAPMRPCWAPGAVRRFRHIIVRNEDQDFFPQGGCRLPP